MTAGVIKRYTGFMNPYAWSLPNNQNFGLRMDLQDRPGPQRQVGSTQRASPDIVKQMRKSMGHALILT